MKQTYQEWLMEQTDLFIKIGNKIPDNNKALLEAVYVNEQTGLSVLILDEDGKGVYFVNADGYVEYV